MKEMTDSSAIQTQIQEVNTNSTVVLNGSLFNICTLSTETGKSEISSEKFGPVSASSLVDGSLFTVENSKGKIFSTVGDNFTNVSVSEFDLSTVNHGVDIATSTVPAQLLQHDPVTTSENSFIQVITSEDSQHIDNKCVTTTSAINTPVVTSAPIGTILEIIQVNSNNNGDTTVGTQIVLKPNHLNVPKRKGGWPKGKRRKEPKDSSIPKPPVTGYILYANEHRNRLKKDNPTFSFSGITKLLGAEWSSLEPAEKQKYLDKAEEDKKRYIDEFKAYQESEEYISQISKKKSKSSVLSVSEFGDTDIGTIDDVDSELLHCKVCDQYFSSVHNRKEHMFGKTHIAKVSEALQCINKSESEGILKPSQTDGDSQLSIAASDTQTSSAVKQSEPLDIEAYLLQVMDKNADRELELHHLRKELDSQQNRHLVLVNTIREYEEIHSKYLQDVGNAKAYGSALATQINTLRMVPTLFGVINF